jgi:predicted  nucleic acid-binding Zn-ribbon protein
MSNDRKLLLEQANARIEDLMAELHRLQDVIEALEERIVALQAALRVRTLGITDERQQDEDRASGDRKLGRD